MSDAQVIGALLLVLIPVVLGYRLSMELYK
ncbi:MAG: photosystem I reaction center subunit XII [Moorea sp. SIO3G5]|nr:photosystem I reaction center subunit XII [Moorena sp. SIO3G5]